MIENITKYGYFLTRKVVTKLGIQCYMLDLLHNLEGYRTMRLIIQVSHLVTDNIIVYVRDQKCKTQYVGITH